MNDIFATNRLQQSLTWLQNHPFIDGHSISISFPRNGGFSIASYLKWPPLGHHPIGFQSATPLVCCVTNVCELSPLQAVSSCSELSYTCRYLWDCNCREHIPKMWLTCLAGVSITICKSFPGYVTPASSTGKTTGLVPHRSANPLTPCSLTGLAMDPPRIKKIQQQISKL